MGKFNVDKFEEKERTLEAQKQARIRNALKHKDLLNTIPISPTKTHPLRDGTLLFGKHRGKKISTLLNNYVTSQYVTGYLLVNKDLPKKFRNQIALIVDNFDPLGSSPIDHTDESFNPINSPDGFSVKVSDVEESAFSDEIPWSIFLFLSPLFSKIDPSLFL
jgi:hypothetical protein